MTKMTISKVPQALGFTPLYDRVVVELDETKEVTAGGMHVPDVAQKDSQYGVVRAVGCGHRLADGSLRPLLVQVDDRVMLSQYTGDEVELSDGDTRRMKILREDELMGIFD